VKLPAVPLQINAPVLQVNTLFLEFSVLYTAALAASPRFADGTHDSMPGQTCVFGQVTQQIPHPAGMAWYTRQFGYGTVGSHFSRWNQADNFPHLILDRFEVAFFDRQASVPNE